MTQQNAAAQQMQQNKDVKTNASNPRSNAKQDLGTGKGRAVGTGGSSTKSQGKQVIQFLHHLTYLSYDIFKSNFQIHMQPNSSIHLNSLNYQ